MLQSQHDEIRQRSLHGQATNQDCMALLVDNEDLANKLSDCWLLLSHVAQGSNEQAAAIRLLKRQNVPGYKDDQTGV